MLGLTALGSGANGDGGSFNMAGKSSTTPAQTMAQLTWLWVEATHASRKAQSNWYVWDTAARLGISIEADGSQALIGFLGAGAVAIQTGCVEQKINYTAGDLDTEGEIITAFNTTNVAINALRTALNNYGLTTEE
jgi:hypothetical protein